MLAARPEVPLRTSPYHDSDVCLAPFPLLHAQYEFIFNLRISLMMNNNAIYLL